MSIRELGRYLAATEGKSILDALVKPPDTVAIEEFVALKELGEGFTAGNVSLGTFLPNPQLVDRQVATGMDRGKAESYVKSQRIKGRHRLLRPDQNVVDDREEVGEKLIEAGRYLIQRALEETGWDGVDRIYFSAAYPPLDQEIAPDRQDHWARRIVKGLVPSAELKFIHLACGGVGFAFVDALKDENLKNKRVLIISLEAIQSSVEPGDMVPEVVFTDGAGVLAFNTRDFEAVYAEAMVVPDRTPTRGGRIGVIRSPIKNKMPQPDPDFPLPDWIKAKGVSPEEFVYTREGAVIQLPPVDEGDKYTRMDGIDTAGLFKKYGIEGILRARAWSDEHEKLLGGPVIEVVCHQPSFPVLRGLAFGSQGVLVHNGQEFKRDVLKGERLARAPRFYFVGDYGNASSRETILSFAHYLERLKNGEVDPRRPFLLSSFGAGSVFVTAIVVPRRSGAWQLRQMHILDRARMKPQDPSEVHGEYPGVNPNNLRA